MKKVTILTAILIATTTFAQVPSYIPTNGLVGWWPFNGNANDESGNGNNGAVNGATLVADRNGIANNAYSFDGVDDKIIISAQSSIPQQSNYTVSLWFKSAISTYNGAFISFGTWFCKLGHDSPGFFYKDEIGNSSNNFYEQAHFGVQPSVNNWNHLILKKTNNTVTLILNNSIIGNMTTYGFSNFNPTSLIQFGYYCCQNYFVGSIDDIGVWNRALTDCEISNIHYSHVGPLNLSAGSDFIICAGNPVTLTASGAATYSWSNNVINAQAFTPIITQNYILTGTDSIGCVGTDTVEVIVLEPTSSSQTQTAVDSYTWPVNNQTYTQSGIYTDTLVNAAGCDSIVTLNLTLSYTGINVLNTSSLSISPNPTAGDFTIAGLELYNNISSMRVTDVNGKLVKELDPKTTKLTLETVKSGVYFLTITAGDKQEVIKIMKE